MLLRVYQGWHASPVTEALQGRSSLRHLGCSTARAGAAEPASIQHEPSYMRYIQYKTSVVECANLWVSKSPQQDKQCKGIHLLPKAGSRRYTP